jgi:hypothetical protein
MPTVVAVVFNRPQRGELLRQELLVLRAALAVPQMLDITTVPVVVLVDIQAVVVLEQDNQALLLLVVGVLLPEMANKAAEVVAEVVQILVLLTMLRAAQEEVVLVYLG